ncbi:MAG: LPXTG cell wall anchor domain-containing protein [Pseudonocardiales bacterium]
MSRSLRPAAVLRLLSLGTVACLAVLVGWAPPASASTSVTSDPVKAAAGWLAGQFTGGTHLESCFGTQCFPDYGLTADAVFGLASAKVAGATISPATTYLAANAGTYIGATDGTGPYPGSYAKLALVAEVSGRDPAAFGGIDLLAALRALQCPHAGCTAGEDGAFKNTLPDGGFPNNVSQSLAILALSRSARAADRLAVPAAVAFLTTQRCSPASGFPTFFRTAGACSSDVDATAFALQALLAAGRHPTGVVAWLAAQQQPTGGFVGNGVVNANSTGLAIEALSAAGRSTTAAEVFLVSLQMTCAAPPADRGAISYAGTAAFKSATALRATPQALLGLTKVPLADLSTVGVAIGAPRLACAAPPSPTPSPVPSPVPSAAGAQADRLPDLANTGADTRPLLSAGVLCLLVGTALVMLTRRRRPTG